MKRIPCYEEYVVLQETVSRGGEHSPDGFYMRIFNDLPILCQKRQIVCSCCGHNYLIGGIAMEAARKTA